MSAYCYIALGIVGLEYLLVIPWAADDDEDIRKHQVAKSIAGHDSSGYNLDSTCYQVVSNISTCHDADSLDDCVRRGLVKIMARISHVTMAPGSDAVDEDFDNQHLMLQ